MSNFPRREIVEILEITAKESSLFSIFVEGKFDKDFFERYFKLKSLEKIVSVYEIDTIEVPDSLLVEKKLFLHSQKSRVIALADEVSRECDKLAHILCVVDADCDRELGRLRTIDSLSYTDFTCLEMYGFDANMLLDVFKFSAGIDGRHFAGFIDLINDILPAVFAVRCCNEELGLEATIPSLSTGFEKKGKEKFSPFSAEKYLSVFVQNNGLRGQLKEIENLFHDRLVNLCEDIRDKAHGHDAIQLFYIYLSRLKVLSLTDEEVERVGNRIFLATVDANFLDRHALFAKILSFPLLTEALAD